MSSDDRKPAPCNPLWTRRDVLGAGAGVVGLAVVGCAGKLPPVREVTPQEGEVMLSLADTPELREPGGVLPVRVAGDKKPIMIVRGEGDEFRALRLKCTHLGCTPGWNAEQRSFDCPCHGSRFSDAGEVLKGPADAPLTSYPVSSDGQTLRLRPT